MAVTVRQFVRKFPEFRQTDPVLVQSKLDDASGQIFAPTWGAKADQGVAYLAAHLLASSPMGETARLGKDVQTTTYFRNYKRLNRQVTYGFRVT